MSQHNEELQGDALMHYAVTWINIHEGVQKADVGPLVQYLRSGDPISKEVRKLLADLFDPQKPIKIFAEIVLVSGPKSKLSRDIEISNDVESWKYENKTNRMPRKEWERIGIKYGIADIRTVKQANQTGRSAVDEYRLNNSKE